MSTFQRDLSPALITDLKSDPLFQEKLLPDIERGEVFPAIRGGYICFYHKGSRLFKYDDQGFTTHVKFGFVPRGNNSCDIRESDLEKKTVIDTFYAGYDEIKARAALYAGPEAAAVSRLHQFSPFNKNRKDNPQYALLDAEVAFDARKDGEADAEIGQKPAAGRKRTSDRIDIMLYDTQARGLLFCECKHFSNPEIWSKAGARPLVLGQVKKYDDQILQNEESIVREYKKYVSYMNSLFGVSLPEPSFPYPKCGLLIFGYDSLQEPKMKEHVKSGSLLGPHVKTVGSTESIKELSKLWEKLIKE